MKTQMAENLALVREAIEAACRKAGRPPEEVELLAVSKSHPLEQLVEAVNLGLKHFGESRVQEFDAKSLALGQELRSRIDVHMIGNLQSNKAGRAAELFDSIDTLDSLKLAERLSAAAEKAGKTLPILLEIKLSPEENKAGLEPDSKELAQLLERLPDLESLQLRGLMTIAPLQVPEAETRACFQALRLLRDRIAQAHSSFHLSVLSMGMSTDFPLAIEEGSTQVRIGTAIFGERDYSAQSK